MMAILSHALVAALFFAGSQASMLRKNAKQDAVRGSALDQNMPSLHQAMRSLMNDDDGEEEQASSTSYLVDEPPPDYKDDIEPPKPDPIYEGGDVAAGFLEKQGGIKFEPEGAQSDLDISPNQRRALIHAFDERPDLFSGCMLIHDFAMPLRVGSAIIEVRNGPTHEVAAQQNETSVDELPYNVVHIQGGIVDRDAGSDAGSKKDATPEVSMFANLQSIAGEVAVIPNGAIARWSSKKKVPIAGYLCNENGNRVLYTLPTPCLATTLGDDGMPRSSSPRRFGPGPAPAPAAAPGAGPAAATGSAASPGLPCFSWTLIRLSLPLRMTLL